MHSELIDSRPDCTVRRIFVSEMNNAVYLLTAKATGEQILIDAADDLSALEALLADGASDASVSATRPARLRLIVATHAHWDHTRATAALAARTGSAVAIGRTDAPQLREERGVEADVLVDHGDELRVDGLALEAIALRGHTPGSIALATREGAPPLLFTGDSLFPGGLGGTWNDPDRFASLYRDVTERLFDRFPDEARVLPGHGEGTTLGAERPALSDWQSRGW